jgi:hypothetical protein
MDHEVGGSNWRVPKSFRHSELTELNIIENKMGKKRKN